MWLQLTWYVSLRICRQLGCSLFQRKTHFSDKSFSLTVNNENKTDICRKGWDLAKIQLMLCSYLHQRSTMVTLLLLGVLADKSVQKSYQCEILQRVTVVVNVVTLKHRKMSPLCMGYLACNRSLHYYPRHG